MIFNNFSIREKREKEENKLKIKNINDLITLEN